MTVKANEVIVDALEDVIIQAEEAPIEQSEARAAIRALNDMMNAWDAIGVSLGYTQVSDLADLITVPLGAIRGIKANLALELCPKYAIAPTQSLLAKAKAGYTACVNLAIEMAEASYPSTLPQGSGNTYPGYADNTFYPDDQDNILTETGGAIALEDGTEEA